MVIDPLNPAKKALYLSGAQGFYPINVTFRAEAAVPVALACPVEAELRLPVPA